MKRYEQILELGLRCPCGGDACLVEGVDGSGFTVVCDNCAAAFDASFDTELDALTAWFVLTGWPIPIAVPKPTPDWKWHDAETPPEHWWLNSLDRNEATIRPWLEEDIEEETK